MKPVRNKKKQCFQCGKKGLPTTLNPPHSFACAKCKVWWINPEKEANNKQKEI